MRSLVVLCLFFLFFGFGYYTYRNITFKQPHENKVVQNEDVYKIPDSWKTFERGNISLSYPETWNIDLYDVKSDFKDSQNYTPLFYVTKPDLSNLPHPEDAPTQNLVMLDVRSLKSNDSLETASNDIISKTISTQFMTSYIYEDGVLNGLPIKYIYLDTGEVSPKKADYPSYMIFKSSQDDVVVITIDFFFVADQEYYASTVKEINGVINTLKVADSLPQDFKDSPEIIVDTPKPYDVVTSPLIVKGRARGTWYFEGEFPITLYYGVQDSFVNINALALGEWMTDEYVDFEVIINFPAPPENEGLLELRKNNPSDIKEQNASISIPLKFHAEKP